MRIATVKLDRTAEREALVDGKLQTLREELIAHVEASAPKGRRGAFSRSKGQTSAMGLSSNPEIKSGDKTKSNDDNS